MNNVRSVVDKMIEDDDSSLGFDADAVDLTGLESELSDMTGISITLSKAMDFGSMIFTTDNLYDKAGLFKAIMTKVTIDCHVTHQKDHNQLFLSCDISYGTKYGSNGLSILIAWYDLENDSWTFKRANG